MGPFYVHPFQQLQDSAESPGGRQNEYMKIRKSVHLSCMKESKKIDIIQLMKNSY
jgi:hypothetical protein